MRALRVIGPEALTRPLLGSYGDAGGEILAAGPADSGPLLWLGAPETIPEHAHPSAALFERCCRAGPAFIELALLESEAEALVLPLVVTARGVLYAEAIGRRGSFYWQPEPLPDQARQALYALGRSLVGLGTDPMPPGVYLAYFAVRPGRLDFTRLVPYPDDAALITLSAQTPDLFECHWRSVLGLPVVEIRLYRPVAGYIGLELESFERVRRRAFVTPEAAFYAPARMVRVQAATLHAAREQLSSLLDVPA